MKTGLFLICFFTVVSISAQEEVYYEPDSNGAKLESSPFHFGLSTGFFTSTSFNSDPAFAQYIAPNLSYDLTDKFSLSTGLMLVRGSGFNQQGLYGSMDYRNPYSPYNSLNSFGYVMGSYKVDDKLTIKAAVYNEFNKLVNRDNLPYRKPSTGYALGFEYQVNENFHFGMQISKGNTLGTSPFNMPFGNHGFSNSIFSPAGVW